MNSVGRNRKAGLSGKGRDSYMELIGEFPLRPIRTKGEYEAAGRVLDRLAVREEGELDRGEADYLEVLEGLIDAYDAKHFDVAVGEDHRTPVERLRGLMESAGMKVSDLGRLIGSVPNASSILKGDRELSKEHIRKLSAYFRIDAGYFL